jgi:hypothetical protein
MPEWTAVLTYLLCLLSSTACAILLVRNYTRTGTALLLWSAACFVFLALSNLAMVVDLLVFPTAFDLSELRIGLSLVGVSALIYGFVWEVDR